MSVGTPAPAPGLLRMKSQERRCRAVPAKTLSGGKLRHRQVPYMMLDSAFACMQLAMKVSNQLNISTPAQLPSSSGVRAEDSRKA